MVFLEKYLDLVQIELSAEYVKNAFILAAICGLCFFGLFLIIALKIRNCRRLGIVAAIAQFFGAIGAAMNVVGFHKHDFMSDLPGTPGNPDETVGDILLSKIYEFLGSPTIGAVGGVLIFFGWVLVLIYMVKIREEVFFYLGMVAIVIHFLRFVFVNTKDISPTKLINSDYATEADQIAQDYFFFACCAIPYILFFIAFLLRKKRFRRR